MLVIDDIRDRHWDARKGWRTTAVRFGLRGSRTAFVTLVAFAYAAPFAIWRSPGLSAWVLLPLATLPLAARAVRAVLTHDDTASLFPWTPRTAMLGMVYAALSGAGLALSR